MEIDCQGEMLRLLPEKAVYWPRARMVLVADLHLGKSAAFRSAGLPVPEGDGSDDLERLGRVLDATGARELLVLGDLLHARASRTRAVRESFACWRAARPDLRIGLVMGNHDHAAGAPPADWGIDVCPDRLARGPFVFVHDAAPEAGGYAVGGHVHPAIRIPDGRRGGFRLPCFLFAARHAILPAFGSFTGVHVLGRQPGERVFAIADACVEELPEAMHFPPARERKIRARVRKLP